MLDPPALAAILSWPVFSITSYKMLRGLAQQNIRPMTVLDVGANVGQFAVAAAKMFPLARVFCLEPSPDVYDQLKRNLRGLRNVTAFEVAAGDTEGVAQFHVNSHSHCSSLLELAQAHRAAFPRAREVSSVAVKTTTLDALFAAVELKSPVLLKLDVQGYEAHTLRGAVSTLRRVDYAVLEASFKPMYEGEILFLDLVRMMECYGFRFRRPVDFLADPATREILQVDALFERVPNALEFRGRPDG